MAYNLHYDSTRKFLSVTLKDQFSPDEFSELMRIIVHSEDYPPEIPILWDGRLINMPSVDSKYENKIIDIRRRYPERGKSKIAILVSNDLGFGMSRMYEMLSGTLPQKIMVFRDYDKAVEWLLHDIH